MTSRLPVLCNACKHLRVDGATCAAFPSAIPRGILVYGDDHREPVKHQGNDVVYELKESAEARKNFGDWLDFAQA